MMTKQELTDQWNEYHCRLVEEERINKIPNYRNEKMADYCELMIEAAKLAYYKGEPIMLDEHYDRFEDMLRDGLRPNSKVLEKVGS